MNPPRPVNPAQAQKCTFMRKPFHAPTNATSPTPSRAPSRLPGVFRERLELNTPTNRQYWDVATEGMPGPSDWDALLQCNDPNGCQNRLVFVDAGAASAPLDYHLTSSRRASGVIVVWCGDLQLNQTFDGVIFNLYGDGSAFGASNCAADSTDLTIDRGPATNGVMSNNGVFCQCWLYAQGGDETRAGIEIDPGSTVKSLPSVIRI